MGCESTLTIYRKYNNFKIDDGNLLKIKNDYSRYNEQNDSFYPTETESDEHKTKRLELYKTNMPVVLDKYIASSISKPDGYPELDVSTLSVNELRDRYYIDGHPCDKLMSFDFISDFHELWDEWNMGRGENWSDNEISISREDASKILEAVKYLLNGEYSKKLEKIMGNKWIKIFGEEYPRYSWKKNDNIYLDKIDSGSYRVSFGDKESERELEEENASKEYNMEKLKQALEIFLNDDPYDKSTDLVLVYDVSM